MALIQSALEHHLHFPEECKEILTNMKSPETCGDEPADLAIVGALLDVSDVF